MTEDNSPHKGNNAPRDGKSSRGSPGVFLGGMRYNKEVTGSDTLLDCLVFLSRYYENSRTAEVFRAYLPDFAGRMTVSQFVRGAVRANLTARVVKRPITQLLESKLYPLVVISNDDTALVLVKAVKEGGDRVVVMDPQESEALKEVSLEEIKEKYSGYIILVRPSMRIKMSFDVTDTPKFSIGQLVNRNKWVYVQILITAILTNFFYVVLPLFVILVYDRVLPNDAEETLWALAIGCICIYGFEFIIRTLRAYFTDIAGSEIDLFMNKMVFNRLLDLKLSGFSEQVGVTMNTINDVNHIREMLTSIALVFLVDIPFIIFFVVIIWLYAPLIGVFLLSAIITLVLIRIAIQMPLLRNTKALAYINEIKNSILIETISSLDVIKQVGIQGRLRRRWENTILDSNVLMRKNHKLTNLAMNLMAVLINITTVGIIVIGVLAVYKGTLTGGLLIASVMIAGRAFAPLNQVMQMVGKINLTLNSLSNLKKLMNYETEHPDNKDFFSNKQILGGIEFKNVSFSYGDRNKSQDVLSEVSFSVRPQERVGIIGRMGVGKSSLIKLLTGLYQPTKGSIFIDGIDMNQIDPIDLRSSMGCSPQDPVLFTGSIRDNISAGQPWVSEETIIEAATIAGVNDFIQQDANGYERMVIHRGSNLSFGQRQAIALARALVIDPKILILDEPYAAMDVLSEDLMIERLRHVLIGRTFILVTHKFSLLKLVDRLIVVDKGRIVDDGARDRVMKSLMANNKKSD